MLGSVLVKVREAASISFANKTGNCQKNSSIDSGGESTNPGGQGYDSDYDDEDEEDYNKQVDATNMDDTTCEIETSNEEVVLENVIDFDNEEDSLNVDDLVSSLSSTNQITNDDDKSQHLISIASSDEATPRKPDMRKTSEYASDSQGSYSSPSKSRTLTSMSSSWQQRSPSISGSESLMNAPVVQKTNRANSIITLIRHKF
jgi:hypothetical protein